MLYDSEVVYFWDSGNIGTMNDVPFNAGANTTTNDNGSVRMETHKLKVLSIIKLAAGNVFTGNFVETFLPKQRNYHSAALSQTGLRRCLSDINIHRKQLERILVKRGISQKEKPI